MSQAPAEIKPTKIRKNVMLAEEVIVRGKALARIDSRNFSNEIEAVINAEYFRRFPHSNGHSDSKEKGVA